jgi:hypothetical protein
MTHEMIAEPTLESGESIGLEGVQISLRIITESPYNYYGEVPVYSIDQTQVSTITFTGDEEAILSHDEEAGHEEYVSIDNTGTTSFEYTNELTGTYETVDAGETVVISPTNIVAKVTSNLVQAGGATGQQPLAGALVKVYDKSDSCVATYAPQAEAVNDNCTAYSTCTTGADGECQAAVDPGNYFVLTTEPNHIGMLPSHSVGYVDYGTSKKARLAFLQAPDGTKSPGKTSKHTGSELWVYQPDYIIWDGTEEYYPFVFESDSDWTVDVCVTAPEGYEPEDGVDCLQSFVQGEVKSILFHLVEVGSVPGKTKVKMKLKSPEGKVKYQWSEVGIKMSKNLAKKKGIMLDKYGYPKK